MNRSYNFENLEGFIYREPGHYTLFTPRPNLSNQNQLHQTLGAVNIEVEHASEPAVAPLSRVEQILTRGVGYMPPDELPPPSSIRPKEVEQSSAAFGSLKDDSFLDNQDAYHRALTGE